MKIIKYKLLSEDADGDIPLLGKELFCPTETIFEENIRIAQEEAHPGTIEVSGEFDPEPVPAPTGDAVTWDELDAAYQEGVDSV